MALRYYKNHLLIALAGLGGLSGCSLLDSSARPLTVIDFRAEHVRHDVLLIFLPGIGDRAGDFERFGFVQAVRQAGLPLDMIAVDVRLGHYLSRQASRRLHREVILPAQREGYAQIWLAGISLGGMGSMLYAGKRPLDVDGIIAIAPYMGDRDLVEAVRIAGGPKHWQPGLALPGDFRPDAWRWLKQHKPNGNGPIFILAYGEGDRFAKAHRMIADMLPAERVVRLPGGHDWGTWLQLWRTALHDPSAFRSAAQAAGIPAQGPGQSASNATTALDADPVTDDRSG